MDHPCYKCGRKMEDGKPFCSECGAPQIRVAMPEPTAVPVAAGHEASTAAVSPMELAYPAIPTPSLPVGWLHSLQPCVIAASVAVLLMFVGVNPFMGALPAGFLAVALARRRNLGIPVRAGTGAKLGAITGLFLFGISTILGMLAVALLHKGAEMRSKMMETIQQAAVRYPGPDVQPFLDFAKSPDGFTFILLASLIISLLALIVLGSLGGALGAALLGRRNRP